MIDFELGIDGRVAIITGAGGGLGHRSTETAEHTVLLNGDDRSARRADR
jgi:NAD(P)-dependent dehydrogenase (short-subunit alcohol dehydrogenase family)